MKNDKENQTFKQDENNEVILVIAFGVIAFIVLAVIAHFFG